MQTSSVFVKDKLGLVKGRKVLSCRHSTLLNCMCFTTNEGNQGHGGRRPSTIFRIQSFEHTFGQPETPLLPLPCVGRLDGVREDAMHAAGRADTSGPER